MRPAILTIFSAVSIIASAAAQASGAPAAVPMPHPVSTSIIYECTSLDADSYEVTFHPQGKLELDGKHYQSADPFLLESRVSCGAACSEYTAYAGTLVASSTEGAADDRSVVYVAPTKNEIRVVAFGARKTYHCEASDE